jgi:outer membrane protein assembly factor BamD
MRFFPVETAAGSPAPRLRPSLLLLLVLLPVLLLQACAGRSEREELSGAAAIYERARKAMDSGNYSNAIFYYEALEGRYPFSNQTKQAQLDLIYCYYKDRQIESAIDAATTFERENPTHPRVDYALYMRGLAYFSGQHTWYHRLFKVDLTRRPPRNAQESFSAFAQLLQRFPDSIYAADARQRMVFLRNRLADYELHVARYYLRRGAWIAALNRATYVLRQYDGAPAVPEALRIVTRSYEELGMKDLADDARRTLVENYPETATVADTAPDKPWYRFW